MSEATPEGEGRHWHWSIPPVPVWQREELRILHEVDDVLGLTLWRALRDVRAWLEAPPGRRATLVQPPSTRVQQRLALAAAHAPALAGAVAQFTHLLKAPDRARPEVLAAACGVVAEWAEEHAHAATAMEFAEAAATLAEDHPALANLAARVCKRAAFHEHAEAWYQRGIGLARRARDDVQYIKARLGYGELLYDMGDVGRAEPQMLKAARRAAQSGRRELAAQTQHDLLNLYGPTVPLKQALNYAEAALRNYPLHHSRLPFLAHDLAYLLVRHQFYEDAYSLARSAVDLIRPAQQALAWGTVGWAAAGAGLRSEYREAQQRGETLVVLHPEYLPGTLCMLAEGAVLLDEWDDAERLAASALAAARRRSDMPVLGVAEPLLDQIATRTPTTLTTIRVAAGRVAALVQNFSHRLRTWKLQPARSRTQRPEQDVSSVRFPDP